MYCVLVLVEYTVYSTQYTVHSTQYTVLLRENGLTLVLLRENGLTLVLLRENGFTLVLLRVEVCEGRDKPYLELRSLTETLSGLK